MIYLDTRVDEMDLAAALEQVGDWRREVALRYVKDDDRRLSLSVYMLLRSALEREYGITVQPEFDYGPHGKPFLRDYPHIHFNLSHCRGAALCVVGDAPVGCDIERVEAKVDMEVCRYCCNENEVEAILGSDNPQLAFFTLWTRKEAFLKYTGEGLTNNLPGLLLTPEALSVRFETYTAEDGALVYTICR